VKNVFRQLIFNDQVSLTLADTTAAVGEGIKRHGLSASQAEIFGAVLSAAAYMSASLKEKAGQITLTLKTDGGEVCVSGNQELHLRGYLDGFEGDGYGAERVGEGSLTVVRDDGYSRPFVGSCGAWTESGADKAVEEYYRISEQLPTFLKSTVKIEKGECVFAGIAVLQPLPFADEKTVENLPKGSALLKIVEEMGEIGIEAAAKKYFPSEASAAAWKEVKYQCHCSREYLSEVLTTVGKDELKRIIAEDGCVKAHCHFCNTDYVFLDEDVEKIFKNS
jgi:molecular chaperone Hsp33